MSENAYYRRQQIAKRWVKLEVKAGYILCFIFSRFLLDLQMKMFHSFKHLCQTAVLKNPVQYKEIDATYFMPS